MKQLRIWSFTLRHCEFVGCVVLRESRHCPLVRHKPTSRKGPKNPVLLTNHQLIFLSVSTSSWIRTGKKFPYLSTPQTHSLFSSFSKPTTQNSPTSNNKSYIGFWYLFKTSREIPSVMSDGPPQLGEIPQQSEISVPTLKSTMGTNGPSAGNDLHSDSNTSIQNAKDSIYNSEVSSWPCWKGYSMRHRWLRKSTGFENACMIWADLLKFTLDAQSALTSIQNHPATQNATDAITNGQVCDSGPPSHWWRLLIMTSLVFPLSSLYSLLTSSRARCRNCEGPACKNNVGISQPGKLAGYSEPASRNWPTFDPYGKNSLW